MPNQFSKFSNTLGVDGRLIGMIAAIAAIWLVFDLLTGGRFVTPRNLFNLSVQTASVAVMATGMVFVIVTRHIDLSVGSLLGFLGMLMGVLQTRFFPEFMGTGHSAIWILTCLTGIALGAMIGSLQGWIVGYLTVPAFIVTLGGFLVWRGAAWWVTSGQTVAPLDPIFNTLGGGVEGSLRETLSWWLGTGLSLAALAMLFFSRREKTSHGFPVKPLWAEITLGILVVSAILGYTALMNAYPIPERAVERMYAAQGLEMPANASMAYGIAIPVVILLCVAVLMTFIAKRTRFGRYVFAIGGNPNAAELSGINTKMMTVKVFALMGALVAIAAIIASARLGSADNNLGNLDELRVIAAAVIGGTALVGGIGTIYGAILGALIMQSLQSGMAMVGVDAPLQSIVVGLVLVFAVYIDIVYRRRMGLSS